MINIHAAILGILWSRCVVNIAVHRLIFLFCLYQKETFEGLSQEALSLCIQSLKTASALITQRKVQNYAWGDSPMKRSGRLVGKFILLFL